MERISTYVALLWLTVLAIILLRANSDNPDAMRKVDVSRGAAF